MLHEAFEAVEELRLLLEEQLERAGDGRLRLQALDPDALFDWVREREDRTGRALALERRILEVLTAACGDEPSPDLDTLRRLLPADAARLDLGLRALRDLGGRLREEDRITAEAMNRSRTFVHAYLSLLSPKAAGYDRSGHALLGESPSTHSVSV